MPIIPFYGASDRATFEIERGAMDRSGRVTAELDELLPDGLILDIGAGDGFTGDRLASNRRRVVGVEPALGMMNLDRNVTYARGSADNLPFRMNSFDGAYATWAYFFPGFIDVTPGLSELLRVVRSGGPIVIVDNYGQDEFSSWLPSPGVVDTEFWTSVGFKVDVIETAFEFENTQDACALLSLFAGRPVAGAPLTIAYNVAVMTNTA